MAQKKSELRTFEGGVNADDSYPFIKPNELVNALNVTAFNNYNQYDQYQGALSSITAPQPIAQLNTILSTDGGTHTLIGKFADEVSQKVFWFFYSSTGLHKIIMTNGATSTILLRNSYVTGGLGWTASMYMSIRTQGNLLIFTDNVNPIRYVNITKTYTVGSLSQSMITFVEEPFAAPLKAERITDGASALTFPIQYDAFQFSYRIQNDEGFVSVLSPLSETILPVRQSDLTASPYSGNKVRTTLNYGSVIPSNWQRIDFCVRYLADNSYFVFKSFFSNIPADVTLVNNHNSGTTALTTTFFGNTIEPIDIVSATKQFESIPIASKLLEISNNRAIFANNLMGYDTPSTAASNLSLTATTKVASNPTVNTYNVFLVLAKNYDVPEEDFPIYGGLFVSYNYKVYSLPLEYSKLRFNGGTPLYCSTRYNLYPFMLPVTISEADLIEIPNAFSDYPGMAVFPDKFAYLETAETIVNNGFNLVLGTECYNRGLCKLVWQVHDIGNLVDDTGSVAGDWHAETLAASASGYVGISRFCMEGSTDFTITITGSASEFASGGSRAFLPTAKYKYGVRFYDEALRSCGDIYLGDLGAGDYSPVDRTLTERINFSLASMVTGDAPSWSRYFAITVAKNSICQDFLQFCPNCIKVARKRDNGIVYVTSDLDNNIQNDDLYGIAVPLDSLTKYQKDYAYNEGDYINLTFDAVLTPDAYSYNAKILGVFDRHVVCVATDLNVLNVYLSSQYSKISSPRFEVTAGYVKSNLPSLEKSSYRQKTCYATIYINPQSDTSGYEVALVGQCLLDTSSTNRYMANFYNGTTTSSTISLYGDCYTQIRESRVFSFTGLSNTTNESTPNLKWVDIYGRIAPVDRVGQIRLINEVRWGNTGIPNANYNGITAFDASDYKLMNYSAGEINMIQGQVGDGGANDLLLIICKNNGFFSLLGQSVLRSTTNEANVTQSSIYIDNINELTGKPATSSPRSFAVIDGSVFWADVLNRKVWLFTGNDTVCISDLKAARVFELLFTSVEGSSIEAKVTGGINKLTGEYYLSVPSLTPTSKGDLPTTTIEYPISFYYNRSYTWVFDYKVKKWGKIFETGREYFNLNNKNYSWGQTEQKAYIEFTENLASELDGMVVIPFNADYNAIKSPLTLKLDASRAPDETWVQADTNTRFDLASGAIGSTMVANVGAWIYRESTFQCAILRDRMSNNAISSEWDAAGLSGARLKGKNISVIFIWYKEGGRFNVKSCQLDYTV